jgi:hypothetical protein
MNGGGGSGSWEWMVRSLVHYRRETEHTGVDETHKNIVLG